mmetsp:Transcript_4409/g.11624  ORF Transcript_4409/g.11624 Transcript_4409/m.11624 type:complete len:301 (-) Transcript_4409:178-1080(-)
MTPVVCSCLGHPGGATSSPAPMRLAVTCPVVASVSAERWRTRCGTTSTCRVSATSHPTQELATVVPAQRRRPLRIRRSTASARSRTWRTSTASPSQSRHSPKPPPTIVHQPEGRQSSQAHSRKEAPSSHPQRRPQRWRGTSGGALTSRRARRTDRVTRVTWASVVLTGANSSGVPLAGTVATGHPARRTREMSMRRRKGALLHVKPMATDQGDDVVAMFRPVCVGQCLCLCVQVVLPLRLWRAWRTATATSSGIATPAAAASETVTMMLPVRAVPAAVTMSRRTVTDPNHAPAHKTRWLV